MKRRTRAIYNGLLVILFVILAFAIVPQIIKAQAPFFDVNDPIGVFQNYDNAHSYEFFRVSGGVEYFGGTIGQNCVILGPSFCNAVQFIEASNNDPYIDNYVFLELPGEISCSGVDFGNVDPLTPEQFFLECLNIATNVGYWPYGTEPQVDSGFGSFLGTTTPLALAGEITEAVQITGDNLAGVVTFAGVPLAFTIGGYLLWFIRRSSSIV